MTSADGPAAPGWMKSRGLLLLCATCSKTYDDMHSVASAAKRTIASHGNDTRAIDRRRRVDGGGGHGSLDRSSSPNQSAVRKRPTGNTYGIRVEHEVRDEQHERRAASSRERGLVEVAKRQEDPTASATAAPATTPASAAACSTMLCGGSGRSIAVLRERDRVAPRTDADDRVVAEEVEALAGTIEPTAVGGLETGRCCSARPYQPSPIVSPVDATPASMTHAAMT